MEGQDLRFKFGENWSHFLSVLNDERIAEAAQSMQKGLGLQDLSGKTFIDIGCGSGLFSLVANRLGARVHSFDYDAQSVACTVELKRRYFPKKADWTIEEASALDDSYMKSLGQFDIVYSWGVLHHTGDMWKALANVTGLVKPSGRLFIAIYNDMGGQTRRWRTIKRNYVRAGKIGKQLILGGTFAALEARHALVRLIRGQNPFPTKEWKEYKKNRGMSMWYDFVDWVGGYPYEVARPEEIFAFYKGKGFTLDYLTTGGLGCNEFVFTRSDKTNSGMSRQVA